jgi:Bacterial pullanase-associated domain
MTPMKKLLVLGVLAATALLAPRPAVAEDFKAPDGKTAIHYSRPDGNYEGWKLHVWESFQKPDEAGDEFAAKEMSDRPLKGVTWFKPMEQSGKDDFGAYWLIDAKEFGNGRVNYIIHKGDKKEQLNQDKFFLIKDGRDVYVVSGDATVYTSKDAAQKAVKK